MTFWDWAILLSAVMITMVMIATNMIRLGVRFLEHITAIRAAIEKSLNWSPAPTVQVVWFRDSLLAIWSTGEMLISPDGGETWQRYFDLTHPRNM